MKDGIKMVNLEKFIDGFAILMNACKIGEERPLVKIIVHPEVILDIKHQMKIDRLRLNYTDEGKYIAVLGVPVDDKYADGRKIAELKSLLNDAFNACSVRDMLKVSREYESFLKREG